jgi:hypothetical protein
MVDEKYLNAVQASKLLGITKDWLLKMVANHQVPFHIENKKTVFLASELLAYQERLKGMQS